MTTFSIQELKEKLKALYDEVSVLEVLDIRIEDILDRFEDHIRDNYDALCDDFSDDFGDKLSSGLSEDERETEATLDDLLNEDYELPTDEDEED